MCLRLMDYTIAKKNAEEKTNSNKNETMNLVFDAIRRKPAQFE